MWALGFDPGAKVGVGLVRWEAQGATMPKAIAVASLNEYDLCDALPALLQSWQAEYHHSVGVGMPIFIEKASSHAHANASQRSATMAARSEGYLWGYLIGLGARYVVRLTVAEIRKGLGLAGNCRKLAMHEWMGKAMPQFEIATNAHNRDALCIAASGALRI